MPLMNRVKDPKKVKAGQARQRQIRAQVGDAGYRDYQRARYLDALAAHPDFHQRGGRAANSAQLHAWGLDGYLAPRRAGYATCVLRYGHDFARQCLARAHEQRRQQRLRQPTDAEAALRELIRSWRWTVLLPYHPPFVYHDWRSGQSPYYDLSPTTAVAEATVGRYVCDLLLPHLRLVLEVEGGIHALTRDRDRERTASLTACGLTVLTFTNDDVLHGQAETRLIAALF